MKEYIVVISCALFVLGAVILGSHVGLFDAGRDSGMMQCIELLGIGQRLAEVLKEQNMDALVKELK